jgi:hypothetical protein
MSVDSRHAGTTDDRHAGTTDDRHAPIIEARPRWGLRVERLATQELCTRTQFAFDSQ